MNRDDGHGAEPTQLSLASVATEPTQVVLTDDERTALTFARAFDQYTPGLLAAAEADVRRRRGVR